MSRTCISTRRPLLLAPAASPQLASRRSPSSTLGRSPFRPPELRVAVHCRLLSRDRRSRGAGRRFLGSRCAETALSSTTISCSGACCARRTLRPRTPSGAPVRRVNADGEALHLSQSTAVGSDAPRASKVPRSCVAEGTNEYLMWGCTLQVDNAQRIPWPRCPVPLPSMSNQLGPPDLGKSDYVERNTAFWEQLAPMHIAAGREAWAPTSCAGAFGQCPSPSSGSSTTPPRVRTRSSSGVARQRFLRGSRGEDATVRSRHLSRPAPHRADASMRLRREPPARVRNAEQVAYDHDSFDLAVSEYGEPLVRLAQMVARGESAPSARAQAHLRHERHASRHVHTDRWRAGRRSARPRLLLAQSLRVESRRRRGVPPDTWRLSGCRIQRDSL